MAAAIAALVRSWQSGSASSSSSEGEDGEPHQCSQLEEVLASAGEVVARDIGLPELLDLLRGQNGLRRRLTRLATARNTSAHPDVRLCKEIQQHLSNDGSSCKDIQRHHATPSTATPSTEVPTPSAAVVLGGELLSEATYDYIASAVLWGSLPPPPPVDEKAAAAIAADVTLVSTALSLETKPSFPQLDLSWVDAVFDAFGTTDGEVKDIEGHELSSADDSEEVELSAKSADDEEDDEDEEDGSHGGDIDYYERWLRDISVRIEKASQLGDTAIAHSLSLEMSALLAEIESSG